MDLGQLPALVDDWYPGFLARFPARISLVDKPKAWPWLLSFIYLIDSGHRLRFATDAVGAPLFAASDVAAAFSVDADLLAGLAVHGGLTLDDQRMRPVWTQGEHWFTIGGLVLVVDSLQPRQIFDVGSLERLAHAKGVLREGLLKALGASVLDTEKLNQLFAPV